jgi:signal transduction histidine kinase
VRIGVVATLLALAALAVFPFVPRHGPIDTVPYSIVLVLGIAGGVVVVRLPWGRLLDRSVGEAFLYAWSILDIGLIAGAEAATGGGRSPLVLLFALTTLFFVMSYPRPGQLGLLLFTYGCHLAVIGLTGESLGAGLVFLQFALLAVLAFLGSFLSDQLVERVTALADARHEANRRAALLAAVANAASAINVLEPERVLASVIDSLVEIGFEAANLCLFEEGGKTYRVVHGRGLPEEYLVGSHPADMGMPGLVRERGATVVLNDYAANPRGVPLLRQAGFEAVIASPIWDKGTMIGVLVGGSRDRREVSPEEVEAFKLLARQAEAGLANARRFEDERLMVQRLVELDEMKRDFIANVSHELRTPLTVIQGMGKTLGQRWERLDDEMRRDLLARVNSNADALASTINALLDYAQLEAGRLEAKPLPFDLGALVERSVERLSSLFGERSIDVNVERGLVVAGDEHLIERVLDNLLSNAAKYTSARANVQVSAATVDGDVRVAVVDDGPGIAPADLKHLGERFFRGADREVRAMRGSGLGLAFAGEVLALHGRSLDIDSAPGRGSAFAFRLPLAAGARLNGTVDGAQEPV